MQYRKVYSLESVFKTACIMLLISCLFFFCNKKQDELIGTDPLSDVLISGLDPVYRIEPGASLKLQPKVNLTSGKEVDSSRYRYEWYKLRTVGYVGPEPDYKVISTKSKFEYTDSTQGAYDLSFRVTDQQTNLFIEREIRVFVANAVYEGWMLLGEHNGQAQMNMLSYHADLDQYRYIENALNLFHSQGTIPGKPLFIDFTITSFFELYTGGVVLGTPRGIGLYNGDSLRFKGTFQDLLPIGSLPDFTNITYGGRLKSVFLNIEGALYAGSDYEYPPSFNKVNRVQELNGTLRDFKAAPFMAIAKGFPVNQTSVFFDEASKELLWYNLSDAYCHHFGPGRLFNFKTDKDLLYLGYTEKEGGQYVALLQAPDTREVYLARFSLYDQLYYEKITAPMIDKAEQFALHPVAGTLLYSIGEQLYAVDETAKESRLLATFDGRVISKIKFNSFLRLIPTDHAYTGKTANEERYKTLQNQLIVCTYNPLLPDASGAFILFDVDLNQWTLQERFRQEGLPKIVDVVYKER